MAYISKTKKKSKPLIKILLAQGYGLYFKNKKKV